MENTKQYNPDDPGFYNKKFTSPIFKTLVRTMLIEDNLDRKIRNLKDWIQHLNFCPEHWWMMKENK